MLSLSPSFPTISIDGETYILGTSEVVAHEEYLFDSAVTFEQQDIAVAFSDSIVELCEWCGSAYIQCEC